MSAVSVTSYQRAIKKKCLECSGGQQKEVETCPVKDCPLYGFRQGAPAPAKPKAKKQRAA